MTKFTKTEDGVECKGYRSVGTVHTGEGIAYYVGRKGSRTALVATTGQWMVGVPRVDEVRRMLSAIGLKAAQDLYLDFASEMSESLREIHEKMKEAEAQLKGEDFEEKAAKAAKHVTNDQFEGLRELVTEVHGDVHGRTHISKWWQELGFATQGTYAGPLETALDVHGLTPEDNLSSLRKALTGHDEDAEDTADDIDNSDAEAALESKMESMMESMISTLLEKKLKELS